MSDLSVVVMTWNRGGMRVHNLLVSLLRFQTVLPREVVIVDTSNDQGVADDVALWCRPFRRVRLVRRPMDVFAKSLALNIGIQATSPTSRWVAVTDIDLMFGPDMVRALVNTLSKRRSFVLTEPMRLPETVTMRPFADYDATCMQASWWGPSTGPGALQATERGVWFAMRGYDQRFVDGLGGMDVDMMERALSGFGRTYTMPFSVSRALHQWHPPSEMKDRLLGLVSTGADITANPAGWGDL